MTQKIFTKLKQLKALKSHAHTKIFGKKSNLPSQLNVQLLTSIKDVYWMRLIYL